MIDILRVLRPMNANMYLLLAVTLWGLNYHFARQVVAEVSFLEGGFWRYALAVVALLLVNFNHWPNLAAYYRNLKSILIIGIIGLFVFNLFFFYGMSMTSGINGALIIGLNPAITLVFSKIILKTEIKKIQVLGIIVAFLGVLFLLLKGDVSAILHLSFNKGDVFVLISTAFFALHHVWVKKYQIMGVNTQQFTLMTSSICLICYVLIMPFTGIEPIVNHSTSFWIGAVGVGVLGTCASYIFWNKGVQMVGADVAGTFINIVPLSAGVFSSLFGEKLYFYHFVSGMLIILGLLITRWKKTNGFTKSEKTRKHHA